MFVYGAEGLRFRSRARQLIPVHSVANSSPPPDRCNVFLNKAVLPGRSNVKGLPNSRSAMS